MTEEQREKIRVVVSKSAKDIESVIKEATNKYTEIWKEILLLAKASPYNNIIEYDTGIEITSQSTSKEKMVARLIIGILKKIGFTTTEKQPFYETGNIKWLHCSISVAYILELGKKLKMPNGETEISALIPDEIKPLIIEAERTITPLHQQVKAEATTTYNDTWDMILKSYETDPYQDKIAYCIGSFEDDSRSQMVIDNIATMLTDDGFFEISKGTFEISTDTIRDYAKIRVPKGTNKGDNNE